MKESHMPLIKNGGLVGEIGPEKGSDSPNSTQSGNFKESVLDPNGEGKGEISSNSARLLEKESRKKFGGRRISDRIKPLLARIVSVVSSENINEAFFYLTDELKELFDCQSLTIYSANRSQTQLFSRNLVSDEIEEKRVDISDSNIQGYAFKRGVSLNINNAYDKTDLARYPGLSHDPKWDSRLKIKTLASMVIPITHNQKKMGLLEVTNNLVAKSFSQQYFKLAQELAKQLGNALEKLEQEEHKDLLQKIGMILQQGTGLQEVHTKLIPLLKGLFGGDETHIYAVDPNQNEVYTKLNLENEVRNLRFTISPNNIVGWVALEKRMANIADFSDKESLAQYHPDLRFDDTWTFKGQQEDKLSMMLCPMIFEDRLFGVVQIINRQTLGRFDKATEKNIISLAQMLAIAFQKESHFQNTKPHKFSFLVQNGLVGAEELEKAIAQSRKQKQEIETIIIDELEVRKKDVGKSLEKFYGMPYVPYKDNIMLPKRYFRGLNKNHLIKNHWVPIHNDDQVVVILLNDPSDMEKIRSIKSTFPKKEIQFRVSLKTDIQSFLMATPEEGDEYEDSDDDHEKENLSSLIATMKNEEDGIGLLENEEDDSESAISEKDSSIVRLVNKIITDAYDNKVSDIHIEPGSGKDDMVVRYRNEGECEVIEKIPNMYKQAFISRIKIMAQMDIAERRLPQDGKIKMRYGKKTVELRVATCPTVGRNEDVVLRILADNKPKTIDQLRLTPRNEQILKVALSKPYGLILAVGPTGSGKTTTLHSGLGFINTPKKKIITAEDPVEITQPGLRQVQIQPKIGLDFAKSLRSFLRCDPDVIMVGEMRDTETCSIALEASLTGHLVFSTLHTNSAPETVTRLLDMGMNAFNFADSLLLIVAQRLVKTLCENCKEEYHPRMDEYEFLIQEYGLDEFSGSGISYSKGLKLFKPKGCSKCHDSGYSGRVGLHELLPATPAIKKLIMKNAMMEEIRSQAVSEGMTTIKQDGILKIFKGIHFGHQTLGAAILRTKKRRSGSLWGRHLIGEIV